MTTEATGKKSSKGKGLLEAPLDRVHQEAFVATVREGARIGSVLAIGIVLGLALAWIQGIGRTRR
jgi:hypothetical protein